MVSETKEGREKILEFIKTTKKSLSDLAVMFGVSKQYMSQVLNGTKQGAEANELILAIINAFRIR